MIILPATPLVHLSLCSARLECKCWHLVAWADNLHWRELSNTLSEGEEEDSSVSSNLFWVVMSDRISWKYLVFTFSMLEVIHLESY